MRRKPTKSDKPGSRSRILDHSETWEPLSRDGLNLQRSSNLRSSTKNSLHLQKERNLSRSGLTLVSNLSRASRKLHKVSTSQTMILMPSAMSLMMLPTSTRNSRNPSGQELTKLDGMLPSITRKLRPSKDALRLSSNLLSGRLSRLSSRILTRPSIKT